MNSLHVAQNCLALPLLNDLESKGVNVARLINKSGLRRFDMENPETYIPLSLYYRLLEEIRNLGIDNFISEFHAVLKVKILGTYGELFHLIPNLLEAGKFAEQFNQTLMSNEVIRVETSGKKTICHVSLLGKPNSSWKELELITLIQLLDGIRLACGDNWAPDEIHLRSTEMPDMDLLFPLNYSYKVKLGQKRTQLILDTRLLANEMKINGALPKGIPDVNNLSIPTNCRKIVSIIESTNRLPSLPEMADYFDISVSSLKRSLALDNQTYKRLVDNWRFKQALRQIENPKMSIKEIAYNLGYTNANNFSRAFKRWTKSSPEIYRYSS